MRPQASIGKLLLIALPLGFAGLWQTQRRIDKDLTGLHQEQDELVLRSGKMLKAVSLEYAPLIAELYWTRAVQYYGDKRAHDDPNFDLLWPLLDITTTLDPQLLAAYRFGATFLSERPIAGAGRPDLGVELVQRGIKANPEYWRFYEDLGFIYYIHLKDYAKASAAFLEGSKNPQAYEWMKVMAARIAEKGESRATSMFLWNELYQSTKDPAIKQNALAHLRLLRAEADCEQLDVLAAEYEKRTGKRPGTVRELINAGMLSGAPLDPFGTVYVFSKNGKAEINPSSPLLELKNRYDKPL
jgi:hypothetical protein